MLAGADTGRGIGFVIFVIFVIYFAGDKAGCGIAGFVNARGEMAVVRNGRACDRADGMSAVRACADFGGREGGGVGVANPERTRASGIPGEKRQRRDSRVADPDVGF